MALSSEPKSQHVYMSTPFIWTKAAKPCRLGGVLSPAFVVAWRTFGLDTHCWPDAVFSCFLVLPCGRGCEPLPQASKVSLMDFMRSVAIAASLVVRGNRQIIHISRNDDFN